MVCHARNQDRIGRFEQYVPVLRDHPVFAVNDMERFVCEKINKIARFFVSERDNPWPNEWRAESALFLAAVGVFHGWGGFAIHISRYNTDETTDQIGRPVASGAIGGHRYRGGV